jgi:hypothetical protein
MIKSLHFGIRSNKKQDSEPPTNYLNKTFLLCIMKIMLPGSMVVIRTEIMHVKCLSHSIYSINEGYYNFSSILCLCLFLHLTLLKLYISFKNVYF